MEKQKIENKKQMAATAQETTSKRITPEAKEAVHDWFTVMNFSTLPIEVSLRKNLKYVELCAAHGLVRSQFVLQFKNYKTNAHINIPEERLTMEVLTNTWTRRVGNVREKITNVFVRLRIRDFLSDEYSWIMDFLNEFELFYDLWESRVFELQELFKARFTMKKSKHHRSIA